MKGLAEVHYGAVFNLLGVDCRYRTGEVYLFLHTVTYHYYFVQHFGVFCQHNIQCLSIPSHLLGLVTDVGNLKGGSLFYICDVEFAVYVCDGSLVASFHCNGGTDNGLSAGVTYYAGAGILLLHRLNLLYFGCCGYVGGEWYRGSHSEQQHAHDF